MITLQQYVKHFETKTAAAAHLGWSRTHLNQRLASAKAIWINPATREWWIKGGSF
jgi:hypothetical protein